MENYCKTLNFTVVEAAMVYVALADYSDKLNAMLNGGMVPDISRKNMLCELAALEIAMCKLSAAEAKLITD